MQTITFSGIGTVSGRVLNPDSSSASYSYLTLTSRHPSLGTVYGVQTDAAGYYTVPDVPVSSFTIVVTNPVLELYGEGKGAIEYDGDTAVVDVILKNNMVQLPVSLYDGNNNIFTVNGNGSVGNGTNYVFGYGVSELDVEVAGSTLSFTGGTHGSLENNDREIAVHESVAGLDIVRKVFVSETGYFARHLESLTNATTAPMTVTVRVNSHLPVSMGIIDTSNGDGIVSIAGLENDDRWMALDDEICRRPHAPGREGMRRILTLFFEGIE
jgi:hypothetical protein